MQPVDWIAERLRAMDILRGTGIHLHGHPRRAGADWRLYAGVDDTGRKHQSDLCTEQPERCINITRQPKTRLPPERRGITHKVTIESQHGDADVFIIIGLYPSGKVGELFVNIGLQGSTLRGTLDAWARMVSVSLQWGVPLEDIIEKFKGVAFEPAGRTTNKDIPQCNSIVDYTVRWLELQGGVSNV